MMKHLFHIARIQVVHDHKAVPLYERRREEDFHLSFPGFIRKANGILIFSYIFTLLSINNKLIQTFLKFLNTQWMDGWMDGRALWRHLNKLQHECMTPHVRQKHNIKCQGMHPFISNVKEIESQLSPTPLQHFRFHIGTSQPSYLSPAVVYKFSQGENSDQQQHI